MVSGSSEMMFASCDGNFLAVLARGARLRALGNASLAAAVQDLPGCHSKHSFPPASEFGPQGLC